MASEAFARSEACNTRVMIRPSPEAQQHCRQYGLPTDSLPVRLVKVPLASGETEIFATSLLDEATYPTPVFKPLYHLRWGVEEAYKTE